jgi:hypothetical protein
VKVADLFALLGLKVDRKSFAVGDRLMSGIKTAVGALAAVGTIKLGFDTFKGIANLADGLDELSQKVGVPIEAIQQLGYAAGFSGVETEALGDALGTLARNMDRAARGSKEQAGAFKKAGVAVKDNNGELRPLDDVLGDIADKFASMPDGARKAALATRLFRGQGKQLIPFLNEGRDGIARLRQEFEASGAQISGDTARDFAAFNDNFDRFKNQIQGVKVQLATALLPALSRVLEHVLAWVRANRKLLVAKITSAIKTLGRAVVVLYRALSPLVVGIYRFVEAVVDAADKLGILKYALVAAAVAIGVSWAGALLPFVLLAAVIGGIILLAEDLVGAFTGKDSLIKRALQPAIDWLYDTFGGFFSWYEEKMIALGLMKGKDVTSNKMLGDKRAREFQSGKASLVPADEGNALDGKFFKLGATARNQQFISSRRDQYARDQLRAFASNMVVNPAFVPAAKGGQVVNVGGSSVTVNTTGGDPKAIGDEVDKRMREFAAEQARAMVASVGGTR